MDINGLLDWRSAGYRRAGDSQRPNLSRGRSQIDRAGDQHSGQAATFVASGGDAHLAGVRTSRVTTLLNNDALLANACTVDDDELLSGSRSGSPANLDVFQAIADGEKIALHTARRFAHVARD